MDATDSKDPAQRSSHVKTLWRPEFEHDACGIGALANINGHKSHQILDDALSTLSIEEASGWSATPVTARASCSRFRIASSVKKLKNAARSYRKKATTASPCSFCRKMPRA